MIRPSDLDTRRREISVLVDEIKADERALLAQGVDLRDEEEWLEVRDIVARIERRLLANMPTEAAE
jgi:hypothetical protein